MARQSAEGEILSEVGVRQATRQEAEVLWDSAVFIEELEPRLLLSHIATPGFLIYHSSGATAPAAVTSPSGLTPATIRQAYGINGISWGSIANGGAGQTIAIVDAYNDPNIVSDLSVFDSTFGLPNPTLVRIGETGSTTLPGTDPAGKGDSWAVEISLDVEWAHAIAPQATIVLVEASSASTTDLFTAVKTAAKYPGVSVVSMSWGASEFSGETSYDSYFTTPSGHGGVTFVAATGDSGAYANGGRTMAAEYPATSPNVLAVGGTYLVTDANGNYVSESGWGNGTSSASAGGSGGGISRYEIQPTYQKGVATQSTTNRTIPDVSMDASPNSGVAVYDSWDSSTSPWEQVGGTSLAAPMWAGLMALVDQGRAMQGLGALTSAQALADIYALPASDFHDVTSGNNGYAATAGYDLVTGRGSPVGNLLVPAMVGVAPAPVPAIGSLTITPGSVYAGTTVTLTAGGVQETSGTATVTSVSFYEETAGGVGLQVGSDKLVGSVTNPGSTCSVTFSTAGLAPGTYTFYAQATDSAKVTSTVLSSALVVEQPAPANDNFANAAVLAGTSATATGTNVGATKETGEPAIAGNAGGASIWYAWTAPASGKVSVSTAGSNFDTILGVYTGTSVSGLATVASNDDASRTTLTSALTFNAVKGTVYHIAVDGYNGATGNVALALSMMVAPANDSFASAAVLTGNTVTVTGTNVGATRETGEPVVTGTGGGASVWYAWTATKSGTVSLNTTGSNFDTTLGVYTGTSVSSLKLVASNDDAVAGRTLTSALTFAAVANTTYYFQVDGYAGATGSITLNLLA